MNEPMRTDGRTRARRASPSRRGERPTRVPEPNDRTTNEFPRLRAAPARVAPPFGALLLGFPPVATVPVGRHEPPEHLFRRLLGAYLGGAREFVVVDRTPHAGTTWDVVRTFCRRTRHPEIVSAVGAEIRLRDRAYESPVLLPERLAQMGRKVVAFHREAVASWARLPFGDDQYWERRDDEIDREAWYVQRLAALRIGRDGSGVPLLGPWTVARSLERIADHATVLGEVGRRLVDLPDGAGSITTLKQFHGQAMDHLEGVLAARDDDAANDLLDTGDALLASGRALSDRLLPAVGGGSMPPATAAALSRVLESIGRTIAYAQDLAQVALDRAIPVSFAGDAAIGPDPIAP